MNISNSDVVLGVHAKPTRSPQLRNSWSSDDVKDPSPPHPAIHRPPSRIKPKQVAFWDSDSTDTQMSYDVKAPYSRNSWSCESEVNDYFPESPKFSEISSPETPTDDKLDREQCRQSSGNSTSESDAKDETRSKKVPAVHRSPKTKRVVSWEVGLINDVMPALSNLKIGVATSRSKQYDLEPKEVFLDRRSDQVGGSPSSTTSHSPNPGDHQLYSKEIVLAPPKSSMSRPSPELYLLRQTPRETGFSRNLNDGDVRRIVDGILKELRPLQPERSLSCSSSCSGCCSCCCGNCSNYGVWTPRPSTPAVDIPRIRQKPAFSTRALGNPLMEPLCSCKQCVKLKPPAKLPSVSSSPSWSTNYFCAKCLPPFDNDSLDSKISFDSLNQQSIFSLDSLNSLTDPDSLEYSKTSISTDSLDSLDSCCNYDSLSDSKDSGFFSCSLPVVC